MISNMESLYKYSHNSSSDDETDTNLFDEIKQTSKKKRFNP